MITISTIAELAGVSKSTVSRVITNHENVSDKTRRKVLQIMADNNYTPNRYAQILNNKSTKLIGVIVPDISNPYFPEIIQQIEYIATTNDYKIILCNTNNRAKSEYEYLDMLSEMRADGTILLCPTSKINDLSAYEDQAIVSIDSIINKKHPYVCSDFYKGGYIAGKKLIENGCKNVLHVSGHSYFYANIARRKGFDTAISSSEDITRYKVLSDLSISRGYTRIKSYLLDHPEVDGIFADNDSIAFTILRILNELKIKIPESIKVIGYDDNFMIPMVYPLLSTIRQPIKEIGTIAANTLISMVNRQQVNYENILDVEYIKRDTTLV